MIEKRFYCGATIKHFIIIVIVGTHSSILNLLPQHAEETRNLKTTLKSVTIKVSKQFSEGRRARDTKHALVKKMMKATMKQKLREVAPSVIMAAPLTLLGVGGGGTVTATTTHAFLQGETPPLHGTSTSIRYEDRRIPHGTKTVKKSAACGERNQMKIMTPGMDGNRKISWNYHYMNGQYTHRTIIGTFIEVHPVTEVKMLCNISAQRSTGENSETEEHKMKPNVNTSTVLMKDDATTKTSSAASSKEPEKKKKDNSKKKHSSSHGQKKTGITAKKKHAVEEHRSWMRQAGIAEEDMAHVDYIVFKESTWSPRAVNPSGAYGLCQALPAVKMASAGADWRTNPVTQLKWCAKYAEGRYDGGWDGAFKFWVENHWW